MKAGGATGNHSGEWDDVGWARCSLDRSVLYLSTGNGNEQSIPALLASRRAAKPAGPLERLQRLAQTLVLDSQRIAQLRPRQDRTVGQKVQYTLLEACAAFGPGAPRSPPGGSSPRWSRPARDRPSALPALHGARWRAPGVLWFVVDTGWSRRRRGCHWSRAVPGRQRRPQWRSCACERASRCQTWFLVSD